jgi:hypothetical protein
VTTDPLRWFALRASLAMALVFALLGLFAGIARLRDAGALWIAVDIALVAAAGALLLGGLVLLREAHARSATVRAWATLGAALLLLLLVLVELD